MTFRRSLRAALGGAAIVATAVLASACYPNSGMERNVWPFPGGQYPFDILPEMHYQQSYKQQEPRRLYPPDGSVPIGGREVLPPEAEMRTLRNPVPASQTPERGQSLYQVNCIFCHGEAGKGDGRAKTFFEAYQGRLPADLTAAQARGLTDGEIYNFLARGKNYDPSGTMNGMPPFGNILTPEDRWLLVNYVRSLQR